MNRTLRADRSANVTAHSGKCKSRLGSDPGMAAHEIKQQGWFGTYAGLEEDSIATDQTNLLFRVYVPSGRLYAAEAHRLLSLFRDWLITTRRQGARQAGYRTASGEVYEFFADAAVIQSDRQELFASFSDFLTLCAEDPSAAADLLAPTGLGRASSADLVARSGREVRRLQVDLQHEWERRTLAIRHSLEEQLLEKGVALRQVPGSQLDALLERLVPGPSAATSWMLLAVPGTSRPAAPITVNINPRIISAVESTIIQNVQGTVHLGPQAKEILSLVERYGGQEAPGLESAVHELEDTAAPPAVRSAAKRRLKKFLGQLAGTVRDVGVDLLEKYLESKGLRHAFLGGADWSAYAARRHGHTPDDKTS